MPMDGAAAVGQGRCRGAPMPVPMEQAVLTGQKSGGAPQDQEEEEEEEDEERGGGERRYSDRG